MSTRTRAILAIVVVSVLWATSGVVNKVLLRSFDPLSVGFFRMAIAGAVMLPLFLKYNTLKVRQLVRDVIPISLLSAVNFVAFVFGIKQTTSNAAYIIYTTTPIVTTLIAHWTIGEKVMKRKVAGILVGFIGVLIILLLPLLDRGQALTGDFMGNILIVIAMVSWAGYIVGTRYLVAVKKYHPTTITTTSMIVSFMVFLVSNLIVSPKGMRFPAVGPSVILLFIYSGVCVTAVTYLLHQWAIQHVSASSASLTNYLQPVFAVVFNMLLLGEQLTLAFIAGSILVFAGVFLATGKQLTGKFFLSKRRVKRASRV